MLQLKFQIDSVLHKETQEPCSPVGVPHAITTAPTTQKRPFLGGEIHVWPWFLLKIPSSVTDNCTEALPSPAVLHTHGKYSRMSDMPITTASLLPPHLNNTVKWRERGKNYELYKILCNKHSSPPFSTIRSAGGSTILTTLSLYVIKRHKAS